MERENKGARQLTTPKILPDCWEWDEFIKNLKKAHIGNFPPLNVFPGSIKYNRNMHLLCNRMIELGVENNNREIGGIVWSLNSETDNRDLFINQIIDGEQSPNIVAQLIVGTRNSVTARHYKFLIDKARPYMIPGFFATIHSHPVDSWSAWDCFSLGDLASLEYTHLPASFLVTKHFNWLVMRSHESTARWGNFDRMNFEEAMLCLEEKHLKASTTHFFLQNLLRFEEIFRSSEINVKVARDRHLALYRGEVNQPLVRVYPPVK